MNIFFEEIQKYFDLLNKKETKQSSFMTALEYMLKIADRSEHETETCTITADVNGDIVIVLKTKKSQLTIMANSKITYIGIGPVKEDKIHTMNTESYSVSDEVFRWIRRNSK